MTKRYTLTLEFNNAKNYLDIIEIYLDNPTLRTGRISDINAAGLAAAERAGLIEDVCGFEVKEDD